MSTIAGKEKEVEEKVTKPLKDEEVKEEDKEEDKEEETVRVSEEEKLKTSADDNNKESIVDEKKAETEATETENKPTLQKQIDDISLDDDTPLASAATTTAVTVEEQQPSAPPASLAPSAPPLAQQGDLSKLPENVRILKEAFPDIDIEVIEAILQVNNNQVENSFETLLGMSDPNYSSTTPQPTATTATEETAPPSMPPRPSRSASGNESANAPYSYYERQNSNEQYQQQQQKPISVEEQMRLDEEFAKKLAMEDEMRSEQRK